MIDIEQARRIFEEFGILTNVGGNGLGVSAIADAGSGMRQPIVNIDHQSEIPTNEELARIQLYLPSLFDEYTEEYLANVMSTKPASEASWRTISLIKSTNGGWHYRRAGVAMPWFPTLDMRPLPPWTLDETFEHIKGVPKYFDRAFMKSWGITKTGDTGGKICEFCNQSLASKGYGEADTGAYFCSSSHALLSIGQQLLGQEALRVISVRAIDNGIAAIAFTDGSSVAIQLHEYCQAHDRGIFLNGKKLSGDFCQRFYPLRRGANVVSGEYGNVTFII